MTKITTPAELDALPVGSVVRASSDIGNVWQRDTASWYATGDYAPWDADQVLDLGDRSATVLFRPDAPSRTPVDVGPLAPGWSSVPGFPLTAEVDESGYVHLDGMIVRGATDTTDDAVERAARAMYEAHRTPGDTPAWEGLHNPAGRDYWLRMARAALASAGAGEPNPLLAEALRYYAERRTMANPKGWAHVMRKVGQAYREGALLATGPQFVEASRVLGRLVEAEEVAAGAEGVHPGCTGASDCPARAHIHGCYAETSAGAEGVVRHVYDGERCRFCGLNVYDEAPDGSDLCVPRAPITHTSETPGAGAEVDREALVGQALAETIPDGAVDDETFDRVKAAVLDVLAARGDAATPTVTAEQVEAAESEVHDLLFSDEEGNPIEGASSERVAALLVRAVLAEVAIWHGGIPRTAWLDDEVEWGVR